MKLELNDATLLFQRMLTLTKNDGDNARGPIVRYDNYDEKLGQKLGYDEEAKKLLGGVYLIVRNEEIVYCGKFTGTFAKRWLYTMGKYVYHSMRQQISLALELEGKQVLEVFAQGVADLREQLGHPDNEWISATSIEEKIIRDIQPVWNSHGVSKKKKTK